MRTTGRKSYRKKNATPPSPDIMNVVVSTLESLANNPPPTADAAPDARAQQTHAPSSPIAAITPAVANNKQPLWGHLGISIAVGGASAINFTATGVSIDTRTIEAGDLFIAVRGTRDGHGFVREAHQKGAAGAIVSWRPRGVTREFPLVFVRNTRTALENLGQTGIMRNQGVRIAVTGSAGKTSVKEMLYHVLSQQGKAHASVHSYNNDLGVALTAARMPYDSQYNIFEMGMNAPEEILELSRYVRPHVAIVTTVGAAHIGAFANEAAIAHAKGEIFAGLMPQGIAVINADNPHAGTLQQLALQTQAQILFFGAHQHASVRILEQKVIKNKHTQVTLMVQGQKITGVVPMTASFAAHNVAAVISGVLAVGGDIEQAMHHLQDWQMVQGRGIEHTLPCAKGKGTYTLIDDSYNANPLSMQAAIEKLAYTPLTGKGRRIAILGDMQELGDYSAPLHAQIIEQAAQSDIHTIIAVGEYMTNAVRLFARPPFHCIVAYTPQEIIEFLHTQIHANDVVLIKGSRSSVTGSVVSMLLETFSSITQ